MGSHADAVLAYGYNLGGGEKWEVAEATGEYGGLNLDWFTDYEGDDDPDFAEAAAQHLLDAIGVRTGDGYGSYRERDRALMERYGVRIETCSYREFPTYLLVTEVFEADSGEVQAIDLPDLARRPEAGGWDAKLRAALAVLGLTPTRREPSWLLTATYG
ncbi:hypothetical protein [Embleya sp. NPDC001921]